MPTKKQIRFKIGKTEIEGDGSNKHLIFMIYFHSFRDLFEKVLMIYGGIQAAKHIVIYLKELCNIFASALINNLLPRLLCWGFLLSCLWTW